MTYILFTFHDEIAMLEFLNAKHIPKENIIEINHIEAGTHIVNDIQFPHKSHINVILDIPVNRPGDDAFSKAPGDKALSKAFVQALDREIAQAEAREQQERRNYNTDEDLPPPCHSDPKE